MGFPFMSDKEAGAGTGKKTMLTPDKTCPYMTFDT